MKKLLFSTLSVFLLFVACSKEEQAPPPPPTPTYTLSFSAEAGGSVSSEGGTYNQGSKITVTATPDAQYLFKEWSDGSTVNPREINVTSNLTLKASFIKKTYPLAVTIEGEGTVQEEVIIQGSTSETEYNAGTTVRLTATPNEGWMFAGWSGDIESEELEIEVPIEKGTAVSALFKRDSFELNITIEGEGTVKEEIIVQPGQYDYETVVRLTAIPAEGYVFLGWSGDVSSEENPIDVRMQSEITLAVQFKLSDINIKRTQVEIQYDSSTDINTVWNIYGYRGVSNTFHYSNGIDDYVFSAGGADYLDANPLNALEVNPAPSVTFRLNEDGWQFHKLDYEVLTWGIRNYDREGDYVVMGDGNEIGSAENWKGDIYLGEIRDEMVWTKVTQSPDQMGYFHGVSIGDLNGDNLIDIAAAPGWHFFTNNGNGSFEKLNVDYTQTQAQPDLYHMYSKSQGGGPSENSPFYCGSGFEVHVADLDGDGINEIIQGNYGNGETWRDDEWQSICGMNYRMEVFKLNGEKYDVAWRSNPNMTFFPLNMGGVTRIRSFDFDNDNVKDIVAAREGPIGHTIEIWKGIGNLEFEPLSFYNSNDYQFIFREFEVMDANNDGNLDVVLYSNGWGSNGYLGGYYLNPNNLEEGVKLNNFILINDGYGKLEPYSKKELILKDVYPEKLTPFMKDGNLHFFGSYIGGNDYHKFRSEFYDEEKNAVKPILWDISVILD